MSENLGQDHFHGFVLYTDKKVESVEKALVTPVAAAANEKLV